MSDREDRLADARDWAREILYGDGFDHNGQPIEEPCRFCEFTGSLGDQVFRCVKCKAYPEDCAEGECDCLIANEPPC